MAILAAAFAAAAFAFLAVGQQQATGGDAGHPPPSSVEVESAGEGFGSSVPDGASSGSAAYDAARATDSPDQLPDALDENAPAAADSAAAKPPYDPSSVLVAYAPGVTPEQAERALASDERLSGVSVAEQTSRYVKLALPEGLSVDEALDQIGCIDEFEGAQPNFYYSIADVASDAQATGSALKDRAGSEAMSAYAAQTTASLVARTALGDALGVATQETASPNDPKYSSQWSLASINAPAAWSAVGASGASSRSEVIIAVVDDEFYTANEDLATGKLVNGSDASGDNSKSLRVGFSDHGTHVAGIVAAETNNAKGVAGVTCNFCKVMPVRLCHASGDIDTASLVTAYDYLLKRRKAGDNIRVANCSLALNNPTGEKRSDTFFYKLVDEAYSAGIVTVAAACNTDNGQPRTAPFYAYPSDYDRVVSVINLEKDAGVADGVLRYYRGSGASNYNVSGQKAKDISAPGTDIVSTSDGKSSYTTKTGTSMAAPVVSAVLGLMFAANPALTSDEATSKLFSSARDLVSSTHMSTGWDEGSGYGEVDAAAAVSDGPYISGSAVLYSGERKRYVAKAGTAAQTGFSWSSSDSRVASVDASSGEVTALAAGEVILTAKKGDSAAYQTLTVYDISGPDEVVAGLAASYTVEPQLVQSWSWRTSDSKVAQIDADTGKLTGLAAGTVTVQATCGSKAMRKTVKVISGSLSPSNAKAKVTFGKAITYTGKKLTPVPTVSINGHRLEAGTHFIVSYSKNVNAGTAKATVKGVGSIRGSRTVKFTIRKAPISQAKITLSSKKLVYNGSEQAPKVTVGDIGTNKANILASGADYKVKRSKVALGSGRVTVTATAACKNFTGTVKKSFSVVSKSCKVYRLYNPYTGEHLYTASTAERGGLKVAGWVYEGVAWKAPLGSKAPVYRLRNAFTGAHHYTKSKAERSALKKAGWKAEGVAWYSDDFKKAAVYRLYDKRAGAHHYTKSKRERDALVKAGWRSEGVSWYGA